MYMSKLRNKLKQLSKALTIIEMYNKYYIMGAEEDLLFLKNKLNNFEKEKNIEKELIYCTNMIESYYKEIPPDFVKQYNYYLREIEKEMF